MSPRPLSCPICNHERLNLYLKGIFDSDETEVWECAGCEVHFLYPIMSDEEERKYYQDYYVSQHSRYCEPRELEDLQKERYQYFLEYKATFSDYIKKSDTVLEIGSGCGGFLRFLKNDFGKTNVSFTEKSAMNVKYLKNEFPKFAYVEDLGRATASGYDLIVGIAVLEHQRDPSGFLRSLRERMAYGGRVLLEMPNPSEPLIKIYGLEEFRCFNYQKQHYFTYSEKALAFLATQAGMEIEKFYCHQQYGLDNHLSWLKHRKVYKHKEYRRYFSEETLKLYKDDLINNKTTDVLGAVFKNA